MHTNMDNEIEAGHKFAIAGVPSKPSYAYFQSMPEAARNYHFGFRV